jgi:hypothetical protein
MSILFRVASFRGVDSQTPLPLEAADPMLAAALHKREPAFEKVLLIGNPSGVPPYDGGMEVILTSVGGQTHLVIEVRGMPLDKIAFFGAGWQIHAEHLAAHLTGREYGDVETRWQELVPPYQAMAATIDQ